MSPEIGSEMSAVLLYLLLGTVVVVTGSVRMLLVRDLMARLVAMNLVGVGSLVILLALGARNDAIDPVLSALVITGLVITVAFTGFGAVLIRRIEEPDGSPAEGPPPEDPGGEQP